MNWREQIEARIASEAKDKRIAELEAENERLRVVYEATLSMLDDWDNDRSDTGSIMALEQALAKLQEQEDE